MSKREGVQRFIQGGALGFLLPPPATISIKIISMTYNNNLNFCLIISHQGSWLLFLKRTPARSQSIGWLVNFGGLLIYIIKISV